MAVPQERWDYQRYGDTRPSKDQLEALLESTPEEPSPLRCDLFLDLAAADTDNTHGWMECAQETIEELAVSRKLVSGEPQNITYAIAAYLRQPEIPNWENALRLDPLQNNYDDLLKAGFEIVTQVAQPLSREFDAHTHIYATLFHYVPLLLGARQLAQNPDKGWLGRLALNRERHRKELHAHREESEQIANSNWSIGVTAPNNPHTWLEPSTRLVVKTAFSVTTGVGRKANNARQTAYRQARIVPISAQGFGFKDPWNIIFSCINEVWSVPPILQDDDAPLLSGAALDSLTDRVRNAIEQSNSVH